MLRVLVAVTLALALGGTAGAVMASRGRSATTPETYRFTGIVSPIAAPAAHVVVEGDGFKFYFSDHDARVRRYVVCIYRGRARVASKCWSRRIAQYRDRDTFIVKTIYPLPLGAWVARWRVAGRTVTSWKFLYVGEGV